MSIHTLLLLTALADGGTRMTLSATESARDCADRREVLGQVLTASGITPLLSLCGTTDLRLSPYIHGVPDAAATFRYRIEQTPATGFRVTPLGEDEACTPAPQADPAIWCARSSQRVLPES